MHGAKARAAITIPRSQTFSPSTYIGKLVLVPTELVDPMPNQPRTHFNRAALLALQRSIESVGQQEAGTIVPWGDARFQLRDGERRFRCCKELGIPFLANVAHPAATLDEEYELAGIANFLREGHTPLEKAQYIRRLQQPPLSRSVADIASAMGVTTATIYDYLTLLDKICDGARKYLDANHVSRPLQFSIAVELGALQNHPGVQILLARRITEERIPLHVARRLIEREAERLAVKTGRGRERKPSDHLKNLRTALRRIETSLEVFRRMSEDELAAMFRCIPASEHSNVHQTLRDCTLQLSRLTERVNSVKGAGTRNVISMPARG